MSLLLITVVFVGLFGIRRGCTRTSARASTSTGTRGDYRRSACDILQCSHRFRTISLQRIQSTDLQRVLGIPGLTVRV